ncbi:OPT superfamily oligopeptide transporter [Panus rudis PR-1116 ss-1]|nr:OPT superfamily oligopeptide transporter [Panus rudis PR-1116 ss-1]
MKHRPPSSATSFPSLDSRDGSIKMEFDFDAIEEEDSPYPEVRAAVSSIDDPEMPVLTFRMWVIGLFLTLTTSAANVFFNFRQPAPTIVPSVLLLIAYPIGKFLAFTLPITTYRIPRWLTLGYGPFSFSMNPGPWNIKEHALVYMMTNVGTTFPYALLAVSVAQLQYNAKNFDYAFSAVIVLATQMTGFGLAGLCRRFLVWPANMLWPENLVLCTLLNTFHAEEDADRGGLTRYRYFVYVGVGAFFFFFLPGYLFTALSFFNWVCWIAPNNKVINQLFGAYSGLGFSVLTFDWTQITWTSSPLVVPWWAQVHTFAGFVLFYWILAPAMYYSNAWKLAYFPMLANSPYDRTGNPYDISRVLNPDSTFNATAFDEYSPLYLPASYAITYLVAFALSSCVVVHTLLYHGRAIWKGLGVLGKWRRVRRRVGDPYTHPDIHFKLMKIYPEVPSWWYSLVFAIFFGLAIVANEVWDTGLPIWGLLLAIGVVMVYVIPSGFIYAMTSEVLSTNLLAQIIPGVALPGKPIANMIFKAYVIQSLAEATSFTQDLKLGHYIKVPPRATFIVQITATTLAGFVQVGVKQAMFTHIPDICTPQQRSFLTCPVNQVYYTASAVWGLIGPSRQFGENSIYHGSLYALIVGALLPIPFWYWQRNHPNGWNKYINVPVVLNAVTFIPPATGINFSSAFLLGFVFQFLIRRRNFAWWSKFNYVTSAALDSGTLVSLLVIFFAFEVPKGGLTVSWWGNSIWRKTADFRNEALLPVPEGGL